MAKLTEMKVPGVGTVNVLNPRDWIALIGGVIVLFVVFATGQNLSRKLSARVPQIDTTIEQPWVTAAPPSQRKGDIVL